MLQCACYSGNQRPGPGLSLNFWSRADPPGGPRGPEGPRFARRLGGGLRSQFGSICWGNGHPIICFIQVSPGHPLVQLSEPILCPSPRTRLPCPPSRCLPKCLLQVSSLVTFVPKPYRLPLNPQSWPGLQCIQTQLSLRVTLSTQQRPAGLLESPGGVTSFLARSRACVPPGPLPARCSACLIPVPLRLALASPIKEHAILDGI